MGVPDHIKKKRLEEDRKVTQDDFFATPVIAYILAFIVIISILYALY